MVENGIGSSKVLNKKVVGKDGETAKKKSHLGSGRWLFSGAENPCADHSLTRAM
jgi:hypothetical protein